MTEPETLRAQLSEKEAEIARWKEDSGLQAGKLEILRMTAARFEKQIALRDAEIARLKAEIERIHRRDK